MKGKPKMFMFVACRGDEDNVAKEEKDDDHHLARGTRKRKGGRKPSSSTEAFGAHHIVNRPAADIANYLIMYASPPGKLARMLRREDGKGTTVVSKLHEALATYPECPVLTLLTHVNDVVGRYSMKGERIEVKHTLNKDLVFAKVN